MQLALNLPTQPTQPTQPGLTGLTGLGYEGHTIDQFIARLLGDGCQLVVDVRLTPLSRKPGFSKTRLAALLNAAGIGYEHLPSLGNPRDNRAGFAAGPDALTAARDVFVRRLDAPAAVAALHRIAELAGTRRVGVLCFERNQARCHRDLVLTAVTSILASEVIR